MQYLHTAYSGQIVAGMVGDFKLDPTNEDVPLHLPTDGIGGVL